MFFYPLSQVSDLDGCKMLRKLFQMIASAQIIERSSWGYSFYAAAMLMAMVPYHGLLRAIIQLSIMFYQLQSRFCWNDFLIYPCQRVQIDNNFHHDDM